LPGSRIEAQSGADVHRQSAHSRTWRIQALIHFGGVLAMVMSLAVPPIAAADTPDQATPRHLKELLWPRACAEQDIALLDSILADKFQMIDAGEGTTRGRDEDGPYLTTCQSSSVLIKRDGRRKAVASHVSGVKRKAAEADRQQDSA